MLEGKGRGPDGIKWEVVKEEEEEEEGREISS